MKRDFFLCALCGATFFLSACAAPAPSVQSQVVKVYATSSAQFWLTRLYTCAGDLSITLKVDPAEPDIYLQIGAPNRITAPVYQIGEEEILIVANNANPAQNLSLTQTQEIFALANPSAQVWVFSSGEDIQRAFDQLVMHGRGVSSSAKIAASAEQMSARVGTESSAVGILPAHWMNDGVHPIFSAGSVPVLAITKTEPQGAVFRLIACLQK